MPLRPILALALGLGALAGCGAAQGGDPAPDPEVIATDAAVRLVDRNQADLVLIVSNQSFDDREVRLRVVVDGVTVVDGDFHVEDQHNWVSFPLALRPGGHEIAADADSGATLREAFHLPRDKTRFAVIDHWTEDDSPDTDDGATYLTWEFFRHAPAFG